MPTPDPNVLQEDFIVGGFNNTLSNVQQITVMSPAIIDERTGLYGSQVYDKMLLDEDVASAFETRIFQACAEGVTVQAAAGADPKDENDIKNVYMRFVERNLSNIPSLLLLNEEIAREALSKGSKVAEVTYIYGSGEDAGRLVIKSIKPRDMRWLDYVVSAEGDLLGVAPSGWLSEDKRKLLRKSAPEALPTLYQGMVPREKVFHFAYRPKNGNVVGSSVLNPAYVPWYMKTQVIPEFFKYLGQFASPSIVGKTPKPSDDPSVMAQFASTLTDESGNPLPSDAVSKLLGELVKFRNGYALAVKGGTEIDLLKSEGNGEAYQFALKYFGDQITIAILGTAQATKEAKHESRGQNEVAQDVTGLRTMFDREGLAGSYTWLSKELIRLNFGENAVKDAPTCSLSKIEQQDKWQALEALSSAYAKGFLFDEQLPEIHDELGLPPLPDGFFVERQLRQEQAAAERLRVTNP